MHPIIAKLKDIVRSLESNDIDPDVIKIQLKEILQNHILNAIYKNPTYREMVFIGGTALRKMHNLDRMSEDLDFDDPNDNELNRLGEIVLGYFKKIELNKVEYSIQSGEHVNRLTFKFKILKDIGLSPMDLEKLHVKVETTCSSKDYDTVITPFRVDGLSVLIKHYDLPTLFAGKLLACLDRVWEKGNTGIKVKGRDYYDLIWYMEQGIIPNEKKLRDVNSNYSLDVVFERLDEKVMKISRKDLIIDLKSYFIDQDFIKSWCDNFHDLYKRYRGNYS